ncbi:MAG TPA: N-6 DNA methylase [Ktedonosporobacter sp.]|jgi:predicted RNA methylase|nr:N-6 DNA methylase [Ktedonosporobacter sp.]
MGAIGDFAAFLASFTDPYHLEQPIAANLNDWLMHALPLRTEDEHDLIVSLQSLVQELQRDARRILDDHLRRYNIYRESTLHLSATEPEAAYDYRKDIAVYDDYTTWKSLVQETMRGELDEAERRDDFALQAAYVVFIRLLLIRVCEDKGVFKHRFLFDGGLQHRQEDIQRYYIFARGNRYSPLLNLAYDNAQHIYAHFFTGRELFNWYELSKERFIKTLYQLSRFNFSHVDTDIIGTIYNTYVNRDEKRHKGQYYTPPKIIDYILDQVGYTGTNVIGANKRLIDPACGSGSFLIAAAKRLIATYRTRQGVASDAQSILTRVQQNLYGFDLNPFACYLAETNLLIQVLDLIKEINESGKVFQLDRFNIYNVDALARPGSVYDTMRMLRVEESDQVNKVKSRAAKTPSEQGFAFVVANPPYGAKLSDAYKKTLRDNWADVFYGQPDTYTFFLKLGIDLLADNGRLGFITPNTYLMGRDTAKLRHKILTTTCIEQIVDLPRGIWRDATVDCVLLFLAAEKREEQRKNQMTQIYLLHPHNPLDKLTSQQWAEALVQRQGIWMSEPSSQINIRQTPLLQHIEDACRIPLENSTQTKVQRLGDVTDSSQGIIPYYTREEGRTNVYIKPEQDVPADEPEWKPLLDGNSYVGRYELRWGRKRLYLKYGKWLYTPNAPKYYEAPKILLVRLRNKILKRRLVGTYDATGFFNRDNYNNIIAKDPRYDLKYILALFNSSLLNYWYGRTFDNVNINPTTFRQLPIYPADKDTQAVFAKLVDEILARHAELNRLREQGYTIKHRQDGSITITIPYDTLTQELRQADHSYPLLTLSEAEQQKKRTIAQLLDQIRRIDAEIDERVLDLYQIKDEAEREKILGHASF